MGLKPKFKARIQKDLTTNYDDDDDNNSTVVPLSESSAGLIKNNSFMSN